LLSYKRCVDVEGHSAIYNRLWVPGLEPLQPTFHTSKSRFPKLDKYWQYVSWSAGEAFARAKKTGVCEGKWRDGLGQERVIWRAK
jgi:hypothetical protein